MALWNPWSWDMSTDADKAKVKNLNSVGEAGMGFAGQTQQNYNAMTGRLDGALNDLQAVAQGRNSIAGEQLRQGMQQGQAAQMSMAAAASPQNAGMAARNAANNMARLSYGLSGQQALAGMQERQQAQQAYAQMLGQARGQDLQATLGGYNTGLGAYSSGLNGQQSPSFGSQAMGAIAGGAGFFGLGGGGGGGGGGAATPTVGRPGYPRWGAY